MKDFDYDLYLMEEQAYLEDNKDIFVFANPHPDGCLVGDCVKRAITIVTDIDYKDVAINLNRYKKVSKAKVFNETKNWTKYLVSEHKAIKLSGFNNMKLGDFAKANPKGRYIVKVRKHCVAVINGKVYDTWNSSFKAVCQVFKIK
jgi:hypothetical protein